MLRGKQWTIFAATVLLRTPLGAAALRPIDRGSMIRQSRDERAGSPFGTPLSDGAL